MSIAKRVKQHEQHIVHFIKFNLVGLLNTAIDFSVFALLVFMSLDIFTAQIISFICALLNSYFCNKNWTFKQQYSFDKKRMHKFICVNLLALLTLELALYIFVATLGSNSYLAKILATPFSLVINFLGNKLWVFADNNQQRQ